MRLFDSLAAGEPALLAGSIRPEYRIPTKFFVGAHRTNKKWKMGMQMKLKTQIIGTVVSACLINPAFAAKHNYDSPKANPRFVIKSGEVYDKKTDLTWQRCSVGQHWLNGLGCMGVVRVFTFHEAQQQGNSKWRLPSKDELESLIDHKKVDAHQSPTIDEVAFPDMDKNRLFYWSSMPYEASGGWGVNFFGGSVYNCSLRAETDAVRLVRRGK